MFNNVFVKIGLIAVSSILFFALAIIIPLNVCEAATNNGYLNNKYGIFVHYVYGDAYAVTKNPDMTTPANLNELANDFDAEEFADDVESFGVEYVIFTAWHCSMNALYPSTEMGNWRSGTHASSRDVIQDLIDALRPKGIKLILYSHPADGADFSPADQSSTGWNDPTNNYLTWNNFINDIYDEMSARYGTDIDGYYFDSGFPVQVDQIRLRNTILANNPNAAMISLVDKYQCCDFGSKEMNHPQFNMWFTEYAPHGDIDDVNTWWGYNKSVSFLAADGGYWWANGQSMRYSAETMFKYTVLQAATNLEGGGVAWSVGPYTDGSWETGVEATFLELNDYIELVSESIKNVCPSTSFVTTEGTRISNLSWGGVATESVDEAYEYIHVLVPPEGDTVDLPVPADGKTFTVAQLVNNGHPVSLVQDSNGVHLTLQGSDIWDELDTVIKMSVADTKTMNIALNKSVTTNAGDGSYAVDGNMGQAYGWYGPTTPQWLVVDLGSSYQVNKFVLRHESSWGGAPGYNTRDYKIQCSDSINGPWTDLVTVTENTNGVSNYNITPVKKRYFRLYIICPSNNGDTAARIYEFEIHVPVTNIALNRSVTTNAGDGSYAVDGNTGQYNGWFGPTAPQWLVVDLGDSFTTGKFILRNESSCGGDPGYNTKDYKIQGSGSINGSWTDLVTVSGNTDGVNMFSISSVNYRYIRLYITDPSDNNDPNARIYEFEIYAPATNVALNKSVTTNAGDGSYTVDGNISQSSGWYGSTAPQWLVVDLGDTYTINKFAVYHESSWGGDPGYNTEDYKIQGSGSINGPWIDLVTVTGNTDGVNTFNISSANYRYIRLYITDPSNNNDPDARIYEFEICNIQ